MPIALDFSKKSVRIEPEKMSDIYLSEIFSEFDYLYYFLSYIVIRCYKRDESYVVCRSLS